ncbi:MAG TPA: hypothetical protein VNO32_41160, partial [Candidatus Acidoferrum sp.]|nr:hypothetical protein [Candidatus Acidoferrum sp.]
LGKRLVTAVITLAARDMVEDYDAISRCKLGDAGADGCHHAGGFMAENAWGGMRAGGNFFKVRATDAAGVHSHEQLPRADLWNRNGFQADVIYAAVNRR